MSSMVLAGDNSWFQLTIDRYQFPHNTNDEWDSNWLVVEGQVRLDGREWMFIDPCLTTFEVQQLADWLEAAAAGTADKPFCGFVEPNLQFDLVEARVLRVSFALESAPPWAEQGDDWRKHGFNVPIGPSLGDAAQALRRQLKNFPVRGPDPGRSSEDR